MISFIVIGRNEGEKLTACFNSILQAVEEIELPESEIIYVDSASTDDSIERAKAFKEVRVFRITGVYNAAIGRNIGAREAKGDVFFFIDGDMEIRSDFLPLVLDENQDLKHKMVSGNFMHHIYDTNGNFLREEVGIKHLDRDKYLSSTGGIFLIKREVWEMVGGMNPRFKKGQDLDLALRLVKRGIFNLRIKEHIATHHMVHYLDRSRMWSMLFNKDVFYSKSLIYRTHFFNLKMYKRLIRNDYSVLFLILLSIAAIVFQSPIFLLAYPVLLAIRVGQKKNWSWMQKAEQVVYIAMRDVGNIIFFFTFFPPSNKEYTYEEVV